MKKARQPSEGAPENSNSNVRILLQPDGLSRIAGGLSARDAYFNFADEELLAVTLLLMHQLKSSKSFDNGNGNGNGKINHPANHSFELRDPVEVETPHGLGIVMYITVYGVHGNDMWCVANKGDGRIRHYETTQLKLAFNGVLGLNKPVAAVLPGR